jgi:uncharacterized membrane protein (UPF0127 family)
MSPPRLVLAFAFALAACDAEAPPRAALPTPPSNNPPPPTESKDPLTLRREATEVQALKSVGAACAVDGDCPLYLRCAADTCQVPPAVDGQPVAPDQPAVVLLSSQGEAQFYMELAIDDAQKQRGLMHRPRMSDQWSMLFVYPEERPLSFWMRNTLIPLDMIFIDDAGVVTGVVEDAEPLTETGRSVPGLSRYVLEINAGLAARYGLQKGARVRFARLPDEHLPRR